MRKLVTAVLVVSLASTAAAVATAEESYHLFPTEPSTTVVFGDDNIRIGYPSAPGDSTEYAPKPYILHLDQGPVVVMISRPDEARVEIGICEDSNLLDEMVNQWVNDSNEFLSFVPRQISEIASLAGLIDPKLWPAKLVYATGGLLTPTSMTFLTLQGSSQMAIVQTIGDSVWVAVLTPEERATFADDLRQCLEQVLGPLK